MKNKIIFLVCAVFLTVACEKEQHTGKESRVSVTVYDENGKAMPGIPVKMYDEKDYKAFEQDNLTPPTAGATANAVSYTHLDVYKRQRQYIGRQFFRYHHIRPAECGGR